MRGGRRARRRTPSCAAAPLSTDAGGPAVHARHRPTRAPGGWLTAGRSGGGVVLDNGPDGRAALVSASRGGRRDWAVPLIVAAADGGRAAAPEAAAALAPLRESGWTSPRTTRRRRGRFRRRRPGAVTGVDRVLRVTPGSTVLGRAGRRDRACRPDDPVADELVDRVGRSRRPPCTGCCTPQPAAGREVPEPGAARRLEGERAAPGPDVGAGREHDRLSRRQPVPPCWPARGDVGAVRRAAVDQQHVPALAAGSRRAPATACRCRRPAGSAAARLGCTAWSTSGLRPSR